MKSARDSTPTLTSRLVFNPSKDAQHGMTPRLWRAYTVAVVAKLRDLAPYAALVLMPGGSLMALLLWLYRRQKSPVASA